MEGNMHVEVAARPIRFAFILGSNPAKKDISNVIKHCCETYGGAHNIIIHSNGERFDDWWGKFLIASDPDAVICRGKFENIQAIESQISELGIQPFITKSYRGESATSVTKYSPLSVDKIYRAKATEALHYGPGKKINVVNISRAGNFTLLDYFYYGMLSKSFRMNCGELINFVNPHKTHADISDSAVELTTENIKHDELEYFLTRYEDSLMGPYVVVTGDENSLQDCCLFWNWRALSSKQLSSVIWINKTDIHKFFQKPTDFFHGGLDFPTTAKLLTSITLGMSTSKSIKEQLSITPDDSKKFTDVGFYYKHPSEYDSALASTIYFTDKESFSPLTGNYLRIDRRTPTPHSHEDCLLKNLVVDLALKSQFPVDKSGVIVSPRHKVEDVLTIKTDPSEVNIRVSRSGFTLLLQWSLSAGTVSVRVNSAWEIISSIFNRRGLIIDESSSGKHIHRSLELVGGVEALAKLYRNEVSRVMLNAFLMEHSDVSKNLEGLRREVYRRSYTVKDLMAKVLQSLVPSSIAGSAHRKSRIKQEVNRWIEDWLQRGVLISGFQLDCPKCNFEGWYPIELVGEQYFCTRCRSENRRPHESEIHYRLHESVYQAHRENMMIPILTLDILKTHFTEDSFIYTVPVNLEKGNPNSHEIDIIAIIDGELFIGECKKTNKLANKVFKHYEQLADIIMPDSIVFSTTNRNNACEKRDCKECSSGGIDSFFPDETFTHGVPSDTEQWGTREKIRDFRKKLQTKGISVYTLCAYTLGFEDQSSSKK